MNKNEEYQYVNINVEKVKETIRQNNISESSITSLLDKSASYLYNSYKSGKMNAKTYNNLCDLLGVNYSDLSIDTPDNLYHVTEIKDNKFSNETVKIVGSKLKKYLKANNLTQDQLSADLGYTYNYIGTCIRTNKMNNDTFNKMCDKFKLSRSNFVKYEYSNPIIEQLQAKNKKKGRKYASDNVKVYYEVLKKAVAKASIDTVKFSVEHGYGKDYIGKILRGYTNKISLEVLKDLCQVCKIDIDTVRIKESESIENQPINTNTETLVKTEVKQETIPTEITKAIAPRNIDKYPRLILTGSNGESQEKLLVDKDEFIALNNQLNELLNIVDGVFNQVNQVQIAIIDIIRKSS